MCSLLKNLRKRDKRLGSKSETMVYLNLAPFPKQNVIHSSFYSEGCRFADDSNKAPAVGKAHRHVVNDNFKSKQF